MRMPRRICLMFLTVLLVSCERRASVPTIADARQQSEPSEHSWGIHTFVSHVPQESDESLLRMEIMADYMARYELPDSSYQLLTGHPPGAGNRVRVLLYDERGDSSATVTADRVLYFDQDNSFEAHGEVVVETRQARRLETEALRWRAEDREVETQSFVVIMTPDEQVQGYGLVADEDLSTYRIGRFTARVSVED